jgi:AcrR family transcriptional regulator
MSKRVERGQATRQRLVATAARLFAERGYEATSIEEMLHELQVSRGALYHHFDSKGALFEAVLHDIEAEVAQATVEASRGARDPITALRAGCEAFIELARSPRIRQIVLTDAPAVLGWQKWREIEAQHGLGLLKTALRRAAEAGRLPTEQVDVAAHVLLAAVIEIALMIARSPDAKAATRQGRKALAKLIDGLAGGG